MPRQLLILALSAAALTLTGLARADDAKTAGGGAAVLNRLGRMVGGHWVSEKKMQDGTPIVDLRFEWGPEHKSIRGAGRSAGINVESRHAWDSTANAVYYLDSHGPGTIYFGHVRLEGDELISDFRGIVGDAGTYRTHARWTDVDTYRATIAEVKDGKEVDGHDVLLRRQP